MSVSGDSNDITNLFQIKYGKNNPNFSSFGDKMNKNIDKSLSPKSDTIPESQEISQISDHPFRFDRKTSIDSTSKTDSKSYKERVRNRFQMIKENVGKSNHKPSFKGTTKKLIMEQIRQENDSIEQEIEKKKRILGEPHLDSRKKYDFFVCGDGYSEANNQQQMEVDVSIFNNSTEKLIDPLDHDDGLIEMKYPEYLRLEQKSSEQECFFRPSGKLIDLSKKLIDEEPKYLEDEGFFIPTKPNISRVHCNMIEERLLNSGDGKNWFNERGELNIVENPVSRTSLRPFDNQLMDKNLTVFTEPIMNDSDCKEILVIKENILKVNIKNIKFHHHPLFSLEHVLAAQLRKCVEKYEKYQSNHILMKIFNRLEATRHILINTEKSSTGEKQEQIMKYKRDLKELRESLFKQGSEERRLLKSALALWKNIKRLRSRNGYTLTSLKLIINRESQNITADKKNYDDNLQKAYKEILREYREEFKNKMRSYKKAIQESQDSPRSEETLSDSPKKPTYNVDEDSLMKQLKEKFQESFRCPGEPLIRLRLNESVPINMEVENPHEIARRNLVSSTKIFLKIICNKLTVCKTKTLALDNNFDCCFNEKISILLTNMPKFIKIVVVEQTNALHKNSSIEINLSVPSQQISKSNTTSAYEEFQKLGSTHYKHEAVGAGISLHTLLRNNDLEIPVDCDDLKLNTNGIIQYHSFWENSRVQDLSDSNGADPVLDAIIDKNGTIQVNKLAEWISQTKPDPQNPKNSVLFEYVQGFNDNLTALKMNNYFRLNPHQESFKFCDISLIDDNIRMKILQLRNRNEPEFDGMIVPNRIKEIPLNILKDYKRRIANERDGLFFEETNTEEGYDSKRKNGMRIMKEIHTKIFQKCKNSTNNLEVEDILDEKYMVYLERLVRTITINFFNWFRWKPHLNQPLPELKKTNIEVIDSSHQELSSLVRVTLKVFNGHNIPNRRVSSENSPSKLGRRIFRNDTVKSYVEVRYNDIFDRTIAVEGIQPIWNQELLLILSPSHFDYLNPNSLGGFVTLNVFDELEMNTQNEEVKTKNWLGSLEIPLSAICSSNGMSGYFKLNTPYIHFGYMKEDNAGSANQIDSSKHTYLKLQINVQPNIPKLIPSIDELPCSDLPYIKDYIIKWNDSYNHSFPSRKFSALAISSSGKTTCLVRYIKPLEPPQLNNEGFDVEPDQCAKFVSLIPFTNCNHFYQNVWLSTDQLLHLLSGSIVDHAVTLTCFLLSLKLEVCLLLGFGIPYGTTAYVLQCEHSKETELPLYFIYDVVSGEKIGISDPNCPLQRVYCVVKEQNIWANIQRNDNIALSRFDFTRKSDWLPLFNTDITAPTNSVHNRIVYAAKQSFDELEIQLERKIRKLVAKSRPMNRTIWNKRISNIVKNNLHLLNYVFMHNRSNQEISNELLRNVAEYDVCGYILNFPYTNISSILKKIKMYGFNFMEIQDYEFSLAVQIEPQPSFIACVWVFLAVVKEK